MNIKKRVLLIGGGTGGHILPLKNLTTELIKKGADVEIVVADNPLDHTIITENFPGITTHFLRTGKIRRYLSLQNIIDSFRIASSVFTARKILKTLQPDVLFFKGGFVGFPFLIAIKYLMNFQGKIFSHESDISSGALTKMLSKHADEVFQSFSLTNPMPLFYTPEKVIKTSSSQKKSPLPKIFITGGSQGAEFINQLIIQSIDKVIEKYNITLITGPNKKIKFSHKNFKQYEFLPAINISQKILESDLIIARGGATSLFEIIASRKPSIIIPLPSVARNHQMLNAQFFAKQDLCKILEQNHQTKTKLLSLIEKTLHNKTMKKNLAKSNIKNNANIIAQKIMK